MNKKRKRKNKKFRLKVLVFVLVLLIIAFIFFFSLRKESVQVVKTVATIDSYNYELKNNSSRIYKKYFKELEKELKDNKIDEDKYAELISLLFSIDYYSLDSKVTNQDIGGTSFIHSSLKDKFITESLNGPYKYVKSNLYGKRKQELPDVKSVSLLKLEHIKYHNKEYKDDNAYRTIAKIDYVKNLGYPVELEFKIIHEDNKLSIIEIA